jgi:glutaredoxin-dependent peroxiredoxin
VLSVAVRIGQKVADFSLFDSEGKERKLSEFTQKGAVTVVFFPFAFSGVCDREMCAFRDSLFGPGTRKANLIGISVDSVFTLKVFSETYGLGFPLLSDFNKKIARAFNVLQDPWVDYGYKGVAKRSVFVLDRKGILRYRWVTDDPGQEPPYGETAAAASKLD